MGTLVDDLRGWRRVVAEGSAFTIHQVADRVTEADGHSWQGDHMVEAIGDDVVVKPRKRGTRNVFVMPDGTKVRLTTGWHAVYAAVGDKQIASLALREDRSIFNCFRVDRVWVDEPYRMNGLATAMYDYAYNVGFRPLAGSHVQTDGGQAVWRKRYREVPFDEKGRNRDYPNRHYWRPKPDQ